LTVRYHLAQVNIARLRAPLESEELADFVAALDAVNASADSASGFVWRLQTEDGNATSIRAFEWDAGDGSGVLVNMSVWETIEALGRWVYGDLHRAVLRRRREWFHRVEEATLALWWVPCGQMPTTDDAEDRVRHLRTHGPTSYAFTFRDAYAMPSPAGPGEPSEPVSPPDRDDWLCPA
jgi:hypothetical protein